MSTHDKHGTTVDDAVRQVDGTITSTVGALTLNHAETCALHEDITPLRCTCYIADVRPVDAPNQSLRNVSRDHRGRVTTSMAGFVLTHEEGCIAGEAWPPSCSCFISRLQLVRLPDGTTVPQLPHPEGEQLADGYRSLMSLQREHLGHLELRRQREIDLLTRDLRKARRWQLIALAWAAAGWAFATARGIWGF